MKKPLLYRSVNTRTHGVHHGSYCAYRYERNTKSEKAVQSNRSSMHSHHRHGFKGKFVKPCLGPVQNGIRL